MGYAISWLGVPLGKAEALQRLSFRDTGIPDEANEASFSVAELPTGYTILFSNDFDYWSSDRVIAASVGIVAVGCQVEEHVMYSASHIAENGRLAWGTAYDSDVGTMDTTGDLPIEYASILAAATAEQSTASDTVDHLFSVPLTLAAQITGYEHDRWEYDWGRPDFTAIEPS